MFSALLSALSNATGLVVDKVALAKERIGLGAFLTIGFIFAAAFGWILVPALGRVDWQIALLPNTLFLIFLMVVLSVAWNVLYAQSLQKEKIHHHELMVMMAPLVTVILAAIFYPEQFNLEVFVLALVACGALLFAKSSKEHFFIDRTSYNTFLGVILMSTETIVARELLYSFTPVAVYAIRASLIAIFFLIYYRPHFNQVTSKHWWILFLSSLLGVVAVIAQLYAFSQVGIIYTTLVSVLGPILVFLISWEILHERIKPRVIVAAFVILICVTIATFITFK